MYDVGVPYGGYFKSWMFHFQSALCYGLERAAKGVSCPWAPAAMLRDAENASGSWLYISSTLTKAAIWTSWLKSSLFLSLLLYVTWPFKLTTTTNIFRGPRMVDWWLKSSPCIYIPRHQSFVKHTVCSYFAPFWWVTSLLVAPFAAQNFLNWMSFHLSGFAFVVNTFGVLPKKKQKYDLYRCLVVPLHVVPLWFLLVVW